MINNIDLNTKNLIIQETPDIISDNNNIFNNILLFIFKYKFIIIGGIILLLLIIYYFFINKSQNKTTKFKINVPLIEEPSMTFDLNGNLYNKCEEFENENDGTYRNENENVENEIVENVENENIENDNLIQYNLTNSELEKINNELNN